jgi:hypothetical protein
MTALDCPPVGGGGGGGDLAATGVPVLGLVALAAVVVLVGIVVLLVAGLRRPRGGVAVGLVALLVVAGWSAHQPGARASSPSSCATQGGSGSTGGGGSGIDSASAGKLVITQTSLDADLGPGRPAEPLVGLVVNHGSSATVITTITVTIASVAKAPGAAVGPCDATDYVIVDPVMPVGRTVAAGGSTTFRGATIGFRDKDTDQDGCQGARVALLYTSR